MSESSLLLLPGQPIPPHAGSGSTVKGKPSSLGATLLAAGPGTYSLGPHLLSSRVGYATYNQPVSSSSSTLKGKGKSAATSAKASSSTIVSVGPQTGKRKREDGGEQNAGGTAGGDVVRIAGQTGASAQDAPDQGLIMPRQDSIVIGRITRVNARQATLSILVVDGQPCGVSTHSLSQTPAATNATGGDASAALFAAATGEGNHAAGEEGSDFTGVIRAQDVRATEKDKIRLADCFRVGDIVRASVISLGDARSYFLSTAENRLGVIYAVSSSAPPIKNVILASQGPSSSSGSALSSAADMLEPWSIRAIRAEQQQRQAHGTGDGGTDGTEVPMVPISWQEMRDGVTGLVEKRKCAKPDVLS
ncbi:unnamed protein product [Tilletia controversa]|uniref:Exosome complex component CSL4 C-terminal domain-containing protein n=3 Tax=Tilletia TaxID=13289 RepID=A0A8X7MS08_9BASI|nr:hypothetical protein CF336_g5461 [Tilletia laevis]KAE8193537.1 hypothetical protein CF328_g5024 [Tilletia controversa]KAE8257214.1 hypothetical protein A4X03_0g4741 [Tilletia caries]KAE8196835.1 hypothetical protein CF335_g4758 [Tilletia laevis]KAE8247259.1 hypothetical protein A4X06_0g4586 [Tilletia controversa]